MAKKKNELTYLQMPLPQGGKTYKMTKVSWAGLNKRQTKDTGFLSSEQDISTMEAPYLTPANTVTSLRSYAKPLSMFGFDDFLIVIYRDSSNIKVDYIKDDGDTVYTSVLKTGATSADDFPRCVVQFNVYESPLSPEDSDYTKRLLIFPDKKVMDFIVTSNNFAIDNMTVSVQSFTNAESPYTPSDTCNKNMYYKNTSNQLIYHWVDDKSDKSNSGWKVTTIPNMPPIEYATVHTSRLFGVGNGRIYVSGFNDYSNWNLDTTLEYNESNAWISPAQANTKADSDFTGITSFMNHVVCFKDNFMHEIYNTKNPFRIQDIFNEGSIDNRSIQEVDGKLIFVSDNNVKIYTGSNPRDIGYYLNINHFSYAVSGSDGRHYYLCCCDENYTSHMFMYDTFTQQWSEQKSGDLVLNYAHIKDGMYYLTEDNQSDGHLYKIEENTYSQNWFCETDLMSNQSVNIKHLKKIQLLTYIGNGANLKIYALYDDETFNENTSHLVYSSDKTGMVPIRILPKLTAHYGLKLHICGSGYVRLYDLELMLESGGELFV